MATIPAFSYSGNIGNSVDSVKPTRYPKSYPYDFRSDTVTRPTPEMFQAMMEATFYDDVYEEEETVKELESTAAALLGHEAGLFVVSGTMSNQLAMRTHLQPLQSLICDARSHVYRYECGGAAYHAGAQTIPVEVPVQDRHLNRQLVEKYLMGGDIHYPTTSLVCMENTLNGSVVPIENIREIRELALERGLKMHLDGARLWNAHAETGIPLNEYGKLFDSVSLCFSKGLGAPIGSVLVGSQQFIHRARQFRKVFGGGWRQAGPLAGAALFSLRERLPRMKQDHDRLARLAKGLSDLGLEIISAETNMAFIKGWTVEMTQKCAEKGIRVPAAGPVVRLVVHYQIDDVAIDRVLEAVREAKVEPLGK